MENEPISAGSPETLSPNLPQASDLPHSTPLWKRLIRCNPFYLISAVLLIYGVYRA